MNNNVFFASFLIAVITISSGFYLEKSKNMSSENLQKIFQSRLKNKAIYTKVPRGLIISIDGNEFFDGCNTNIKPSAFETLDIISNVLKNIPNNCVIEDHTTVSNCNKNFEIWEISAVRSSNIADYLMKKKEIPYYKIFYIGYGNVMPLKIKTLPDVSELVNRIDFVLIDYEAKR